METKEWKSSKQILNELKEENSELKKQTTSQKQTIERLREVLQKLCYLNSREQEGIADAMPLPEDWYKTFLQAEQLLNTTEPIKQ